MFLEKNLIELIKVNPILGAKLHSIQTNKKFEIFMGDSDKANINIYDTHHKISLYDTIPIEEVENQYKQFMENYSRYPYTFFYGVGNGVLLKLILGLNSVKTLFVFEPNLELIYVVLNLIDFTEEIKNKRIEFHLEEDINFNTFYNICNNPDIKVFLRTYNLQINIPYYEKLYFENIKKLNKEMVNQIKLIITGSGNDANDSLIGLNHHLKHLPDIIKSYSLLDIINNKNSDYAVIVSTGPSLAKQLPLLKKFQKNITILSVDASLPILQKEGIKPDLVFSMERVEATAKFFENLDKEFLKDTIFIPSSVSHPLTIEYLKDMKVALSQRPFAYIRMFHLHKWGYLGLGMSAANMAFDFAYLSKFKNIAFIGQDLAFGNDGTTHSKGAVYGEYETQYKQNTLTTKGYYGENVQTSKVWDMFKNFFVRDIPIAKEKGLNIYNCTEGGAYIDGAEHISFKNFLEQIDNKEKEFYIPKKLSKEYQENHLKKSKKLVELYVERLSCIKEKIENVFLEVMEQIETLEKLNRDEDLEKIDFNDLTKTISNIDIIKNILEEDRAIMKMSNITNPLIVNAELALALIVVRESKSEIEKKVKLIDWIYEHKSWLFFLAGAIENVIFIMKKHLNETLK